ncbi:hypothetical protein AEM51_07980 [Bacteroidetes bacterium UKL13-3]|nr:hypothetical protein AEM51_07980 [Bacteroidetes bacterium UKL13-3]HCP94219.1 hypothetical protein [Bacteroidota bacterium]
MIKYFGKLSAFNKKVFILSSGSLISQALIVAISPVLTRIYAPESFGLLAVFTSMSAIFASLFSGKYEHAIILPKEDEKAKNIGFFCFLISLSLSIVLLGIMLLNHHLFIRFFNFNASPWQIILLVPFMTVFIAVYSCLQLWFQRKEEFSISSLNAITQSLITIITNVLFGLLGIKIFGLVYGYILSIVFSTIFLSVIFLKKEGVSSLLKNLSLIKAVRAGIEYKKFPLTILWAELLVTFSQQLMPLLLTSIYTSSIVGLFAFSNRILKIPSILLSNSIWGVFRVEAIKIKNNNQPIIPIYLSTLKKLLLVGLLPYLVILIAGQFIFQIAFGDKWVISGLYAQIMSLYVYSDLVAFPLSSIFIICNKSKLYFLVQIITILFTVGGILLGKWWGGDIYSIVLYSGFGILANVISVFLSYKIASRD